MSDNLYLFANNNNGQAENNGSYRLYDMQVKENGELIRDFQSVLDSNNVPCLLDKIKNKFYYNKSGEVFKTKEKPKYKKLKCISTDGNQLIDCGSINFTQNTKFEIDFTNLVIGGNSHRETLFSTNKGGVFLVERNQGFSWGASSSYTIREVADSKAEHHLKTRKTFTYCNDGIFQNNVKIVDIDTSVDFKDDFNYTDNLILFKGWVRNTNTYFNAEIKLHEFKIYQSEQLALDLIPVLDENNTPCMYDKMSEQFFYNQGTGTFGYEIEELDGNSDSYTEIEYIESNGTQYIDTEVVPTSNTDIDMVCRANKPKYRQVEYLQGDGNSYIGTKFVTKDVVGYDMEIKCEPPTNSSSMIFGICPYGNISSSTATRGLGYHSAGWFVGGNNAESYSQDGLIHKIQGMTDVSSEPSIADRSFSLFGNTTSMGMVGNAKIYYAKLYDTNDNLVFDVIPVLDESDTPCMYDKVSDTFFYNQGTGTFSYGAEVGDGNFIMNGLSIKNNTYQYNDTDTTVQSNLVASEGATLTMGSANLAKLNDDDIEIATNNGWSLV